MWEGVVSAGFALGIIGIVWKFVVNVRNDVRTEFSEIKKNVVFKETCEAYRKGEENQIKHINGKLDIIDSDIKQLLRKNGI